MIRTRRRHVPALLIAACAGLALGAVPAAHAGTFSATVLCKGPGSLRFTISGTAPDQTTPGSDVPVQVTRVGVDYDQEVPWLPSPSTPAAEYIDVLSVGFDAVGAQEPSGGTKGRPFSLGPMPVSVSPTLRYSGSATSVHTASPITAAGPAPVVYRIDQISYLSATVYDPAAPKPDDLVSKSCVPTAETRTAIVVPSTGALPSAPAITSVSPASGPLTGGNTVTVKGTGFTNAKAIVVAGSRDGENGTIKVVDDSTLVWTPGPFAEPRDFDLQVASDFGISPVVPAARYSYADAVPTATPTPTPTPGVFLGPQWLRGSVTLKSVATGVVPLSGQLLNGRADADGAFTGDLTFAPSSANLVVLGFIPVKAQLLIGAGQATGTFVGGRFDASLKTRIKLSTFKLLGIELVTGSTCQTKNLSAIPLRGGLSGGIGSLAGTFAISDLTGCGALGGIVSPLTAGKSNAIALSVAPVPPPVPAAAG
ncbi:MAG: IPT/TIG domain-containing protein [Patulibacter minatonensis]